MLFRLIASGARFLDLCLAHAEYVARWPWRWFLGRARPRVNSFDVFDTLIARRSIHHQAVFRAVEAKSGIQGAEKARVAAEALLQDRGSYSLDDIWTEAVHALGLPLENATWLARLEVATELQESIPIRRNLEKVRAGDFLVSDMYLDESVIRSLLRRVSVPESARLVVSNDGKSAGWIWSRILPQANVVRHLGDNLWADDVIPRAKGISTSRTAVHRPTREEAWLLDTAFPALGMLAREVRLSTWCDDPVARDLQVIQADLNLPYLLVASAALVQAMNSHGKSHAVFCARDCLAWKSVFDAVVKILELDLTSEYFWASRVAFRTGGDAYLQYARSALGPHAMVVDFTGSGRGSLVHLAGRLDLTGISAFFLSRTDGEAEPTWQPHRLQIQSLIGSRSSVFSGRKAVFGSFDEFANQAPHPSVRDVVKMGSQFAPAFSPERRSEYDLELVKTQLAVVETGVTLLDRYRDLLEALVRDEGSLWGLAVALSQRLTRSPSLEAFATSNRAENLYAEGLLGGDDSKSLLSRLKVPLAVRSAKALYRRGRRRMFAILRPPS